MTLREELSAIPGVREADIDLRDGRPTAIRIHSDESADQRAIGEAVQAALRRHGLRSRVAPPRTELEPSRAPAPPHLTLTPRPDGPRVSRLGPRGDVDGRHGDAAPPDRRLGDVVVVDNGRRVTVTVSDSVGDERTTESRRASEAQIAAVVRATARLHDGQEPMPSLISLRRWEREDDRFVTVVLEAEGEILVGSAVNDGLELRAIAVAVWQALSA